MRFQSARAPVFFQLLAHRERWRWRPECFSFRSHDLDGAALAREPLRPGGRRYLLQPAGSKAMAAGSGVIRMD